MARACAARTRPELGRCTWCRPGTTAPGWRSVRSGRRPRATRSRPSPSCSMRSTCGAPRSLSMPWAVSASSPRRSSKKADYLIAVKNNQPTLAQAVESLFEAVDSGVRDGRRSQDTTINKGYGRIETRQCVVAHDVSTLAEPGQRWPRLRSAVMIKSIREALSGRNKGERTTEWRYYISSLQTDADEFNAKVLAPLGHREQLSLVARRNVQRGRLSYPSRRRCAELRHPMSHRAQPHQAGKVEQEQRAQQTPEGRLEHHLPPDIGLRPA